MHDIVCPTYPSLKGNIHKMLVLSRPSLEVKLIAIVKVLFHYTTQPVLSFGPCNTAAPNQLIKLCSISQPIITFF